MKRKYVQYTGSPLQRLQQLQILRHSRTLGRAVAQKPHHLVIPPLPAGGQRRAQPRMRRVRDAVEEEDLAEESADMISIAYITRSRLSEGQAGAYCEQKANLIGTQLVILVNRPWIIGQSTALRSPLRTCSRSSSVSAPGIRSALYRYGRPMWNLAIMYRPRSMASATAVAGECGRGGGGGGSRGRVVGMGDVVEAAGVVVVVVLEGDECAAGTGSVSVN